MQIKFLSIFSFPFFFLLFHFTRSKVSFYLQFLCQYYIIYSVNAQVFDIFQPETLILSDYFRLKKSPPILTGWREFLIYLTFTFFTLLKEP